MTSTELVPTNGSLPTADDFARASRALVELAADGRTEALHGAASEAEALRAYHDRNRNRETANRFARLKVEAEALIGRIDIESNPYRFKEDLQVGDTTVARYERSFWRMLGTAQMRGKLDEVLDAVEASGADVSTVAAYQACSDKGVGWVSFGALSSRFDGSITIAELARRAGVSHVTARRLVMGDRAPRDRQDKVSWVPALAVARALGVDPLTLPMKRTRRRVTKQGRKWVKRQRKLTGGRWDEAYLRYRSFVDEMHRLTGTDQRFDDAWEHAHALEKMLVAQMRRDELGR